MYEIELKYKIHHPSWIRGQLKKIKARKLGAGHETNILFDHPDSELRKKGCALRLRTYRGKCILTFKGPRLKGKLKKRREIEIKVSCPDKLRLMLQSLGYEPYFAYTKTRAEYRAPGVHIVLDHLPKLGWFLEIEGSGAKIRKAASRLELADRDIEHATYPQLLASTKL